MFSVVATAIRQPGPRTYLGLRVRLASDVVEAGRSTDCRGSVGRLRRRGGGQAAVAPAVRRLLLLAVAPRPYSARESETTESSIARRSHYGRSAVRDLFTMDSHIRVYKFIIAQESRKLKL